MSYEPTNWKDGDLVTSAKLNKIEQGIAAGGGILIVHDENGTLDKTWQEIYDADVCLLSADLKNGKTFAYIAGLNLNVNNTYIVHFFRPFRDNSTEAYISSSPDDYPTFDNSDENSDSNLPIT